MAHADDLRAEVEGQPEADELVAAVAEDYTRAELSAADRQMLDFAVKLTCEQEEVDEADIQALRRHGFDDTAIHDIVQVTALFNYYTRLADGLGIALEPEWG